MSIGMCMARSQLQVCHSSGAIHLVFLKGSLWVLASWLVSESQTSCLHLTSDGIARCSVTLRFQQGSWGWTEILVLQWEAPYHGSHLGRWLVFFYTLVKWVRMAQEDSRQVPAQRMKRLLSEVSLSASFPRCDSPRLFNL